ncbi:MAG: TatD family hydrolase [Parachlamydiales bacterium]|jgi:TatD DNase family protein
MLIDSHAHITSAACLPDADALIAAAQAAGVGSIVNICTDAASMAAGVDLRRRYPQVFNAGATTPHDVEKEGEECFELFASHARNGDLVAVGETGLDYYYEHSPRVLQQEFLVRYLKLALECRLPVVIHCRDAFSDFFRFLDAHYTVNGQHAPGVLHCFTGDEKEAKEVVSRGWFLSLSGIVTYKKSAILKDVAKAVPLDNLLIETDSPYLAPESKRGRKNQPAYIIETAQVIADLKGIPFETVAAATAENARRLFSLR